MDSYAIAIGSNRRGRHGAPADEVRAAIAALDGVSAVAPIVGSAPLGPSLRRYANSVVLVDSGLSPPGMLAQRTADRAACRVSRTGVRAGAAGAGRARLARSGERTQRATVAAFG